MTMPPFPQNRCATNPAKKMKKRFTLPNLFVPIAHAGVNGSKIMKKTKLFLIALLAGFVLNQAAYCQTNATDANPAAADATATNASSASPAAPDNGTPPAAVTASNETAGAAAANATAAAPAVPESGTPPAAMTASNETAGAAAATPAAAAPAAPESGTPPAAMTASNETAGAAAAAPAAAAPAAPESGTPPAATTAGNESTTNPPAVTEAGNPPAPTGISTNATLPIQFSDVPITTAIESLARLAGINYILDPKIGYGQPDQNGQIKPEPTLSVRWENVTAQQALLALLDNYSLQLVENPKTGIAKITTKDPTAPPPLLTHVYQLNFANTSNVVTSVQSALTDKRSRVVPDRRTSQLVVVATEQEQDDVDTLISQLDKPTRQVLIETKFIELSSNPSTSKGIDWSGTLAAQNVSFGNGVMNAISPSSSTTLIPGVPVSIPAVVSQTGATISPASTTTPTASSTTTLNSEPQNSLNAGGLALNTASGLSPAVGFLSADGVKAVLSFLNQSSDAQVVSTPRVVTLDNETATISVIRAFPIINVTAGTVQTAGGSSITYSNLGTILMVTPRISANDYIWMDVQPNISSFFGKDNETINGALFSADIFDMRSMETRVLIPNAHTLVMGGLVQDNPNASYTKVPILGDIPILGVAFRSQTSSLTKDNLLIFITPTILKDADFKPATTDFLDSQPKYLKDPMNMHTWMDSAQPRGDWSNPLPEGTDQTPTPAAQ